MDEPTTNQLPEQAQTPVSKPEELAAPAQEPMPEAAAPVIPPESQKTPPVEVPVSPDTGSEQIRVPESPASPVVTAPAAVSVETLGSQDFRTRQKEAKKAKKEKRLQKLLELIRQKGSAGNDEIQKFLIVSDATASRYAKELVQRGLIRKVGATRNVRYQINPSTFTAGY